MTHEYYAIHDKLCGSSHFFVGHHLSHRRLARFQNALNNLWESMFFSWFFIIIFHFVFADFWIESRRKPRICSCQCAFAFNRLWFIFNWTIIANGQYCRPLILCKSPSIYFKPVRFFLHHPSDFTFTQCDRETLIFDFNYAYISHWKSFPLCLCEREGEWVSQNLHAFKSDCWRRQNENEIKINYSLQANFASNKNNRIECMSGEKKIASSNFNDSNANANGQNFSTFSTMKCNARPRPKNFCSEKPRIKMKTTKFNTYKTVLKQKRRRPKQMHFNFSIQFSMCPDLLGSVHWLLH